MLTVVGIIAVLVSVSIPIVNSSLEKAQKATDAANERAAKGAMMMESLLTENAGGAEMYYDVAAGQWKTDPPSAGYGKCEIHKGCYLKGTMNGSEVDIAWTTNGTDVKPPLCSGALMADSGGETNSPPFTVQGNNFSWDKEMKVLTIEDGADVTIRGNGNPTSSRIIVSGGSENINITLENVNIDVSERNGEAAFMVDTNSADENKTVTITLQGENKFKSGYGCAGLQKNDTDANAGKLIIKGSGTEGTRIGSLEAIGGTNGAGIGGSTNAAPGFINVEIRDCIVIATGGSAAAGIGGGKGGSAHNLTISNSNVTAKGDSGAEDIGSGSGGGASGGITKTNSIINSTEYDSSGNMKS